MLIAPAAHTSTSTYSAKTLQSSPWSRAGTFEKRYALKKPAMTNIAEVVSTVSTCAVIRKASAADECAS